MTLADAERSVLDEIPVTLVGHPYAPIGMGEQLRSHVRAGTAVRLHHKVLDIFRYAKRNDPAHARLLEPLERKDTPGGIRIFHINGDEVERVIAEFEARGGVFADGYNIVVPAWELPAYPAEWAPHLARFDEVWALSNFIAESLSAANVHSYIIGQAVEFEPGPCLPRRHFGIRESAFVLLNFLDLSSYAKRKNPDAALALFERIRRDYPFRDVQLVLKVKDRERDARQWAAALRSDDQVKVIAAPLDTLGVKSLINACDCFVSLHRSEGFGRGLGEAMALGKLVMGTGWSGNVDFMTPANALFVNYELAKLAPDDYPHWQGQSWAEPKLEHAFDLLRPVLNDPARGRAIAERGQSEVLRSHGNRAVGLRILVRLQRIARESEKVRAAAQPKRPVRRKAKATA
jgi:glycosyltransferase involved in cell wall biosynthesis